MFGANIGTTVTGWLVAVFGFKLKLGALVMPLILGGVILRLFARGRLGAVGWALAGFGLLFVGIETMQAGLEPFKGAVTPENFPADTLLGRLQLVLIGIAITLITQSSSAGVATALVALEAGVISFPQAAAMVIGMDVGTTFTAVLATVGGSTAMRQTGLAHVIYNLMTGLLAFALLGPYVALVSGGGTPLFAGDAQLSIVAFHTAFNALGVMLVIPFAARFARLIQSMVSDRSPNLINRLDSRLLKDPASAVDAAAATLRDITTLQIRSLSDRLADTAADPVGAGDRVNAAIEETRDFVEQIRPEPGSPEVSVRLRALVHGLDHASRLARRLQQSDRFQSLRTDPRLARLAGLLRQGASIALAATDVHDRDRWLDRLRALMRRQRRRYRRRSVAEATEKSLDADNLVRRLDAVRWLHRVAYHLWRLHHYVARADAEPLRQNGRDAVRLEEED